MNQSEKKQIRKALSLQAFLLVLTGMILLSSFFLPYAIAQGDHADEAASLNNLIDAYELLLNECGQPVPNGFRTLQSVDFHQISAFNRAKVGLFFWKLTAADNTLDTLTSILVCLILCLPFLDVIIPVAIILNALGRKPFWVLLYTATAYGDFLWQRTYLDIDNLISSGMYHPGIVLQLFPYVCAASAVLALWMWIQKASVKQKIKAARNA